MSIRERLMDYSLGNDLRRYWKLFRRRERTKSKLLRDIYTFRLNRMAHKAGGCIGRDAVTAGIPSLPHGLHGIYISRYTSIGEGCRIYQKVTIGDSLLPFVLLSQDTGDFTNCNLNLELGCDKINKLKANICGALRR